MFFLLQPPPARVPATLPVPRTRCPSAGPRVCVQPGQTDDSAVLLVRASLLFKNFQTASNFL